MEVFRIILDLCECYDLLQVWIPSPPDEPVSGELLKKWLRRGQKKLVIDDETLFVDPHILKGVLDSKVNTCSTAQKLLYFIIVLSKLFAKSGYLIICYIFCFKYCLPIFFLIAYVLKGKTIFKRKP